MENFNQPVNSPQQFYPPSSVTPKTVTKKAWVVVLIAVLVIAGGAYYFINQNSNSQSPSEVENTISFLSPAGGESWQIGTQQTITWDSSGLPSDAWVAIYLTDSQGTSGILINYPQDTSITSASSNQFTWLIPQAIPIPRGAEYEITPGEYAIKLSVYTGKPDCLYSCAGAEQPTLITTSVSKAFNINEAVAKAQVLPKTCVDKAEGTPVITSISPASGPVGTKVEIKGCNLSGFEADLDAVFVRSDGMKIPLYGGTATGKTMTVTVDSYCKSGSEVGRYSGLTTPCKTVEATPGLYKVYVTAWGKNSNEATFNLTADKISVQIYLIDSKATPPSGSCVALIPITRTISKTEKVATAAIEELLKGPTPTEKASGYTTGIPVQARLNSLTIVNGEARADFSASTESGGSCNQTTDQIRKTLLQFPTIKSVKLSVDGRTDGIFQP